MCGDDGEVINSSRRFVGSSVGGCGGVGGVGPPPQLLGTSLSYAEKSYAALCGFCVLSYFTCVVVLF